ncbi:hypothetical protein PJ985_05550 [Streptomyces sp. ACA25]|nr:hypothetical protein [Streptomyces sp. ACA25]MDB1087030.1 hypothetical protein [Streptomyces sp. ACA25]
MLWTDLRRESPDDSRAASTMLRRAGWVIAVAMMIAAVLLLRPA